MAREREQYLGRLTPNSAQAILNQAEVVYHKFGDLPRDPRLPAAHTIRMQRISAITALAVPAPASIELK